MSTPVRLGLAFLVILVLAGAAGWFYFFAPARVDAAELVPSDTVLFATIPNGMHLAIDYRGSHLEQVIDAPQVKAVLQHLGNLIGGRNVELLQALAPNLSGQSFLALTRFDPSDAAHVGLIAALRPKPGLDNFDAFIKKLNALYPEFLAEGKTGSSQVDGLDYAWIQPPSAPDKICVARYHGWIVTTWGEAPLRDWWDRIRHQAATPALARNPAYAESLKRTGPEAETFLYVDGRALAGFFPGRANGGPGAIWSVGSRFEGGEIVDRYAMLLPRAAQNDLGLEPTCPFETLKFTGPDTQFYWAGSFNWAQVWKNLQAQAAQTQPARPLAAGFVANLQGWAQAHNFNVDRDIIGALGGEMSVQMEWSADSSYPDVGLLVKLDHPELFQPVEAAIVESVRQAYENRAVINELSVGDQKFAALKFVEAAPVSPTITENGPFLGIFLSETHAARSFQRDESMGLLKNDAFLRAIGDRRASAMELAYFDAPRFTARAYQTAQPYLPLLALFDRNLGGMAQSGQLPADVNWLAPIDVWAGTLSSDDAGLSGYSISGIGNQGVLAAMALRQALAFYPGAASSLMGWIAPAVPAAPPDPANPAALPPSPAPTNAAPNAVVPPTTHATPPSSGP